MAICNIPGSYNYGQEGTCEFRFKVNGVCHKFTVVPVTRTKMTLSWDPVVDNWVFFHSYDPNVYLRDRFQAYCADTVNFYRMNGGSRGIYLGGARQPFIIDLIFKYGQEMIVEDVSWESMIANLPFNGFSHITVSTRDFCTGRVPLTTKNSRVLSGKFNFNTVRNLVKQLPFRKTALEDFEVFTAAVDANMAWFKKGLIYDNHCIVRLEYDGSDNIVFLGAETSVTPTVR